MKKTICFILILGLLFLAGCNSEKTAEDSTQSAAPSSETADGGESSASGEVDVDLTALSGTMVYSEVYNMLVSPDDYYGKIVKMNGQFSVYKDEETGNLYFAVIIADATACCSQGLEFVLKGDHTYPDDYPKLGTDITVTGEFQTYVEDGYMYCCLVDAVMS